MLHWREAFTFPVQTKNGRRQILLAGLWLLLLPPVGWLLALGYRAHVAYRMWDGLTPTLPHWTMSKDRIMMGAKAAGIISIHLTPVIVLFWIFAIDSIEDLRANWFEIIGLTTLIPLFLPLTITGILIVYPLHSHWVKFEPTEALVLGGAFIATVFILPAAFMRVSIHRRFSSALKTVQVLSLIARNPTSYCEAWLLALCATILALLSGPLIPWAIPWSYLVIGYAFNEALFQMDVQEMQMF